MKSKWLSRIMLVLIGSVLGVVIGIIATLSYQSNLLKVSYDLITLGYKAWEGNEAMVAYKNATPETARYALEHERKVLEFFYENKDKDFSQSATAQDLAITYVRIGKVAYSTGDKEEAERNYDKGFNIYQKFKQENGKEVTRDSFISFVDKIDKNSNPKTINLADAISGEGFK